MSNQCEVFPDIYEIPAANATEQQKQAISAQNRRRDRVYRAIRYILINDFGLSGDIPEEPRDFPGALPEARRG